MIYGHVPMRPWHLALVQLIIVLIAVGLYLILTHLFVTKSVFMPWSGARDLSAYGNLAQRYNPELESLIESNYSLMKHALDACPYYYLLPIFSYSFI